MRRFTIPMALALTFTAGCAYPHDQAPGANGCGTLAELRSVRPDMEEIKIDQGLDQAMYHYRRFLEDTPETAMTPEAMRRLADLQLEKQFGIHTGELKPREMAAPQPARALVTAPANKPNAAGAAPAESDQDFERRTTAEGALADNNADLPADAARIVGRPSGPLEAIALYEKLLTEYPSYADNDKVLYQMARAFDELGRTEEAIATMERLIRTNPKSAHLDEVQFRRGEYFFTRRRFRDAENSYSAIIAHGFRLPRSMSSRSINSGGRSTSRNSTKKPCINTWRCSTTSIDRLRLRSDARRGR
jgi:tetratricopeptide (TPR) repeat protein